MHLLRYPTKTPKPKPFIPIHSHWEVPEYRRLRGRRYDAAGKFLYETGAKKRADPIEREAVLAAQREAKRKPAPVERAAFSLDSLTLMRGRILLARPPQITEEKGVRLPENKVRSQPYFNVVKVAPDVTVCRPGDRIVLQKGHKPKDVRLQGTKYIALAVHVVALMGD
jgi:hypothetical protein